ncbi:MMPL family transporter [Lactiplantibacillus dongliensis]|uniref:MMPL family transporter n=1 Tax=Lactiplantibacillus dongliensis TaxID=2559919 RepID=A0ABW1R2N1_9LACO|nr:MMPL family transporter [Lactiplantibacillus dongliensis]
MKGSRRRFIIQAIVWLVVMVAAIFLLPNVSQLVRDKGQTQLPSSAKSQVAQVIQDHWGRNQNDTRQVVVVFSNGDSPLTDNQKAEIDGTIQRFKVEKSKYHVKSMTAASDNAAAKKQLISKDKSTELLQLMVGKNQTVENMTKNITAGAKTTGVKTYITGSDILNDDFTQETEAGIQKTEIITVIFIFIVLTLVFRSPITPLVSLFSVGLSFIISLSIVMNLVDKFNFPLSNFTQVFMVVVLFGIGTDYNILLFDQFKEELSHGDSPVAATGRALKIAGRTILFSGSSLLIGFSALGLANFSIYRSAVGVAVAVAILLMVLLTLNPFFMALLGPKLFWPSKKFAGGSTSKMWHGLAANSVRYPLIALVVVLGVSLPFVLTYNNQLNYDTLAELNDTIPAKQGFKVVQKHFSKGTAEPSTLYIKTDHALNNEKDLKVIDGLTKQLQQVKGVKTVASVTQPGGAEVSDLYLKSQLGTVTSGVKTAGSGLTKIGNGLDSANKKLKSSDMSSGVSGAKKLANGAKTLDKGLVTYTNGVYTVNKGVNKLNNSTGSLSSGVNKLASGAGQVSSGLSTLNGKTGTLASGASQLATGSNKLKSGLVTYTNGVYTVNTGLNQLNSKTGTLASGASQLSSGSSKLKSGLVTYTNGVYTVNTGLNQLNNSTDSLSSGINTLSSGTSSLFNGTQSLTSGLDTLNSKKTDISTGTATLATSVSQLQSGASQVSTGLTDLQSQLKEAEVTDEQKAALVTLQGKLTDLNSQMRKLATLAPQIDSGKKSITDFSSVFSNSEPRIATDLTTAEKALESASSADAATPSATSTTSVNANTVAAAAVAAAGSSATSEQKSAINSAVNSAVSAQQSSNSKTTATTRAGSTSLAQGGLDAIRDAQDQLTSINNAAAGLQSAGTQLSALSDIGTLASGSIAVNTASMKTITQLQTAIAGTQKVEAALADNNGQPGLVSGSTQVSQGLSKLQTGADKLASQLGTYTDGVATAAAGADKLNNGASSLNSGVSELSAKVPTLTSAINALATGSNKLVANSASLNNGASQLATGTSQLNAQVPALVSGVSALTAGTNKLAANSASLNSGAAQLASGTNALNAQVPALVNGVSKLSSGASQVSTGMNSLKAQVPTLVSGVSALAAGTNKLAANSDQLTAGAAQLATGNQTMYTTLQSLVGQMSTLQKGLATASAGTKKVNTGVKSANSYLTGVKNSDAAKTYYVPNSVLKGKTYKPALKAYMSGNNHATKLTIVLNDNPSSKAAMNKVAAIQTQAKNTLKGTSLDGATIAIGGQTSETNDTQAIASSDFVRTAAIMLVGILIALMFITRSVLQPFYILGTLLLAYIMSLSLTRMLSNWFLGQSMLTWNTPFFGFIMLIALGVDYSIFLMMKYREFDNSAATPSTRIVRAAAVIGAVVLSAALILSGTFAALMPSGVLTLIQVAMVVIIGLIILVFAIPIIIPSLIRLTYPLTDRMENEATAEKQTTRKRN